jgi:ribosomal protein L16 Arg81 hydroxylase
MLEAYRTHSSGLDCHAKAPTQAPPTPRQVASAGEFEELIRSFHDRGYTVRVPEVSPVAPKLHQFTRALELMLRQPVSASVFWSAAGAQAIVHYDKPDNLIVHLEGKKRWFISMDPPGLQNKWMQIGEPPPNLEHHRVVDVEPGDMMYIPGGTPHTVESTTESLHLAIVFKPLTVREAIIAAVDSLSDSERTFRETAVGRMQDANLPRLSRQVVDGLTRLLTHCRSQDFIRAAMDFQASRATAELPPLAKPTAPPAVSRDTRLRQSPLAISYLRPSFGSLDFSQPGGHIAVHRGVEPELQFIASTDSFRVADLPGPAGEDVKIALVTRLIESGFLEVAA